jgi:ABC-type glycerol-3-phosphate transport system substrate-binding protein
MQRLSRRALLRALPLLWVGLAGSMGTAACGRAGEVQTSLPETNGTPDAPEATAAPGTTPDGAPRRAEQTLAAAAPRTVIIADVTDSGWNHFGQRWATAFRESQGGAEISWRSLTGWRSYPQRIATLQAGGILGDLLEAPFGALLRYWARRAFIRPLDGLLQDADGIGGIFGGALAACRFRGQQYGLPVVAHPGEALLLTYTPALEEAEVAALGSDDTLDDLTRVAETLTHTRDTGPARYGYASRLGLPSAYPILHAFGARLLSADGRQARIAEESGVACLTWLSEQIHVQRVSPRPVDLVGGHLDMLRRGRIATLRHSFGALVALSASDVPVTAAVHPRHPQTGLPPTLATGIAYCISHQSQVPSETLAWMRYMSSHEVGVRLLLDGYSIPGSHASAWSDPRILERFPVSAQVAAIGDDTVAEAVPWNEHVTELYALWERHTVPLWRGETTPQECAAALQAAIEALLALPADPDGPTGFALPTHDGE